MDEILVSVIVATYRRDNTLKNALNSLAEQTFPYFEVVVVDDNDDEEWNYKVATIINSLGDVSAHITFQHVKNHPNQGSAKARNIGIRASRGRYITFLDDDDIYLPEKIEQQYNVMVDTEADYSLTDLGLYYENETLSEIRKRNYLSGYESTDLHLCHLKYHLTGTDAMMFRREYLINIGGFDPVDVGDEYYLMMKAIEARGKFVYVNRCDIKAYVHTDNDGLSSGIRKLRGENSLYEYKKQFFNNMSLKNIRYIRMRHHAVLAFAYLRMHSYLGFFVHATSSFLIAPIECIKMLKQRKECSE